MGRARHLAWCLLAAVPVTGSAACSATPFVCGVDSECDDGYCEADGYCSFGDSACQSGRRYGELAAAGLAGNCVPPALGSSTGTPGLSSTSTSSGSSGLTSSSSTGTSSPEASSGPETTGEDGRQVFTDDGWVDEFGVGTIDGVRWSEQAVRLTVGRSDGSLESRIFDAGAVVSWTRLEWSPEGPYGRALPSSGDVEQYATGNANMTDNVLLFRFDGNGFTEGASVPDASGAGHDGVVLGGSLGTVDGPFGDCAADQGQVRVDIPVVPELVPGLSEFTWSMWYRAPSGTCENGGVTLMSFDSSDNADDAPSVWISCDEGSAVGACPGATLAFNLAARHDDPSIRACASATIDDGQWHHIAAIKRGAEQAQTELYVDGVLATSASGTLSGPLADVADTALSIGGQSTFQGVGDFDEVAIWMRGLSQAEVVDLYRRGARRMEFQVRTCDEPTCEGVAFVGPGGVDSVYKDLDGSDPSLSALTGRYFQYRVQLDRDTTEVVSPALQSVSLTAN